MNALVILFGSAGLLLVAYVVYGKYLERKWGIDVRARTPAYEFEDGVDYVPAKPAVVFGHEFASIAGAGPINGPILAAPFGWLPVLLWILFGGVFFGAVQDFAAMYASVKNKGKTIGYIIETYIGETGKRIFLLFVWLFSILVIAAFADIVAVTFDGFAPGGAHNTANAAAASTSMIFMIAAVILGLVIRKTRAGNAAVNALTLALLAGCVTLGILFPLYLPKTAWLYIVFAYVFFASVTPIWILMQPRDYLNSFLLIALIAAACAGVISAAPAVNLPAFTGFVADGKYLFPIMFVTVACGAVSGFHSLVASGTASKQVANERHILPISFGAMLVECLLAVISLIAVGSLTVNGVLPQGTPPQIFAAAVTGFLGWIGLPPEIITTLITLAISAFALTSIDSVARVGRLALQELWTREGAARTAKTAFFTNKYTATMLTLAAGYLLAINGYQSIWPLFGSANQLLAALALIACAVFLKKTRRKAIMLYIPAAAMFAVTFSALFLTIKSKLTAFASGSAHWGPDSLQLAFAILLVILGCMVAWSGLKTLRMERIALANPPS